MSDEFKNEDLNDIWPNLRGAQDYWYWRDKPIMEAAAAASVLPLAGITIDQLRSREPGKDPPDCEGNFKGERCGIEVSELVHEKTLKSTIKGKPQYFNWCREALIAAIQTRISRKDRRELVKGGPYQKYILILITDEFMLGRSLVEEFLKGAVFEAEMITDVVLALGYDPSIKECPVFSLPLRSPRGD